MKRYYSNYIYIYPDKYYENSIVELDEFNNILNVCVFEKEIERTRYHSGILAFIPNDLIISTDVIYCAKTRLKELFKNNDIESYDLQAVICNIYD